MQLNVASIRKNWTTAHCHRLRTNSTLIRLQLVLMSDNSDLDVENAKMPITVQCHMSTQTGPEDGSTAAVQAPEDGR
jgi:hypothetical protein